MNGLIIKDILMSETKDKVKDYEIEMLNIQIEEYYEQEQDKYY